MAEGGALRIGTSGWSYAHWRSGFYPAGLPQKQWFRYYASEFDSAEINAGFIGCAAPDALRLKALTA